MTFGPRTDLLYYITPKKQFFVKDFIRDEETLIDKLDNNTGSDFMHIEISHNERYLAIGSKVHNLIHVYQVNQGGNNE